MSSSRALTGGTKDVNPQYMRMKVSGAHSGTSAEAAIPVQRLNNKNRSMVMEILDVQYLSHHATSAGKKLHIGIATSKPPAAKPDPSQGYWVTISILPGADVGNYVQDLTDQAGHGMLVAADKLFLFVYSDEASGSAEIYALIKYRWKNVSLTEYIGIVQASQL